ncbi:MAG: sodium-dependent transporter [Clostridia bacterium]|nr:sodium-dependent transporter [Clostridia bacterium]
MDNSNNTPKRERLGSRLGFILLSAGCAIGIGNVWRFPYITAKNGGGLFVLIYLIFLVIMGIPVMTMEFAMGRASQASPTRMYHKLKPEDKKWRAHGYAALAGNVILMMFYTSVSGWMLQYFFYMITGKFDNVAGSAGVGQVFSDMLANPWMLILFVGIVVVLGFLVCSFDMQKGLEKVSKIMMVALLFLIIILAIHSFTLSGAGEGLKFYLLPDISKVQEIGILTVIVEAMNQAFFTLSLGIGSMAIFGSFINKDRSLLGESVNIACLDTFVAITSGLVIFPAFFTYMNGADISSTAGPNLIFVTLPNIFMNMPLGNLWGSLFFLFMSFAAFSTIFAVFQNILSCVQEMTNWSKKKTCLICGVAIFILSIPCILGFNAWANFQPLGSGTGVLDLEDYIVSNILLPLGSLIIVLFCNHKFGWGFGKFEEEANTGKGFKIKKWMRVYFAYILPIIIGIILVYGIVSPFLPK